MDTTEKLEDSANKEAETESILKENDDDNHDANFENSQLDFEKEGENGL